MTGKGLGLLQALSQLVSKGHNSLSEFGFLPSKNSARCTRNSKVLKSQKILRWYILYIYTIYCYFYIFQLTLALSLFVAAPHFMAICTWPRLTPLKASHDSHGILLSRWVGRARSPPNISPYLTQHLEDTNWAILVFSWELWSKRVFVFFLSRPVKWEAHGRTSQNASSQLHSGMAPGISKNASLHKDLSHAERTSLKEGI